MRRAAIALLVALAAGCGGDEEPLTVFAARSLEPALAEQPGVRLSFGGSDQLAAQIRAGARPDVFAAANTELPERLHAEGLVERPVRFASNRLVLVVRADSDARLEPGIRVAIGAPSVPAGIYARRAMRRLPRMEVASEEPDVASIVARVRAGAVDAGFVYATDVRAVSELRAVELPFPTRVEYAAAVIRGGGDAARRASPPRGRVRPVRFAAAAALAVVLTFLTLPVVAIFVNAGPGEMVEALGDDAALEALRLSLETSAIAVALVIAFGTPAAYLLATREFRGKALVTTLIELPLVLPPAVAGIGLLAALGPRGILGDPAPPLILETAGVVVALAFVAGPFYVRQAQAAFEALDPTLLEASRTLGYGEAVTLARVAIPAARPGLLAGVALALGRALGEFGATLMFAGSVRGVTQTAPLAIYERFGTDFTAALALSAVLVAVSLALLLTVKVTGARSPG